MAGERPMFLKLSCAVQQYAWGKIGLDSEVAKVLVEDPGYSIQEDQPYAELWMGTHPKGPSTIACPPSLAGQPLSSWIERNQWSLGEAVAKKFDGKLPFLFKILSINKALSIQAHPNKQHARQLHASLPDRYPDPNHKPEMVIVLRDFEGFCGFRPLREIKGFLESVTELKQAIGETEAKGLLMLATNGDGKHALRTVFTCLMKQDTDIITKQLERLVTRVKKDLTDLPRQEQELLLRLYHWYPGDVGCFCLFFLNYMKLSPGESMFLAPNEPHAYIGGDVIECMSCSDNVIRAGLTPKYRDSDTLCKMLTYNCKPAMENMFHPRPHPEVPQATIYNPPAPEYAVAKISLTSGTQEFVLPITQGPSILLFMKGSGEMQCRSETRSYGRGDVVFLPADHQLTVFPTANGDEGMLLFQAYCEL